MKESVSISATAKGLSSSVYEPTGVQPAHAAVITLEAAGIRFWLDGSVPTATEGHPASAGDVIALSSYEQIKNFKAIKSGAGDAKLKVSYSNEQEA